MQILFCAEEERGAVRVFLRALRRLPLDLPWRATIWWPDPAAVAPVSLGRKLRERVRLAGPADGSEEDFLAAADVVVLASSGSSPSPQLVLRALGAGGVPLVARLPQYEECVRDGELGLTFEPRDALTLAGQLQRLVSDDSLRGGLAKRVDAARPELKWETVTDRVEELYGRIAARRHDPDGKPAVRKKLRERPYIHVDLHMHTDHSHDCATPVETLLASAKAAGLGAIAVTDHNEISGAHEARAEGGRNQDHRRPRRSRPPTRAR